MRRADAACLGFLNLWEILGKSEAWTKTDHSYGKAPGNSLGGPARWWVGVSGSHQGGANSESQVDGNSNMAPACWLRGCGERGPRKGLMASVNTLVWEKSVWCQIIQLLPICLWCLSSCCPSTGAQSEWVSVSLCGPSKRNTWDSRSLPLPQWQIPLFFTARRYGDFSSWHWNPGLGSLVWGWDPPFLKGDHCSQDLSPDFYLSHSMGAAHSASLPLLSVSMWLLLYIFSSGTFIQPDFRCFWKTVVL